MKAPFALILALLYSACVPSGASAPEDCSCLVEMTNEDYLAAYGMPQAAVVMTSSKKNDDGTYTEAVQFTVGAVSAAQLAAAPTILCASDDAAVVSSRITDPPSDFIEDPSSKVLITECSAPLTGETQ